MNKKMNVAGVTNELEQGSAFFRSPAPSSSHKALEDVPVQSQPPQSSAPSPTYLSKGLSKLLSKKLSTEDIEDLTYQLRKVQKFRVNADVPLAWKDQLDETAHRLKVGKYELLMYIIGDYLGEIGTTRGIAQK
jgi:hypothetical protein